MIRAAFVLLAFADSYALREGVSPVQKVIALMQDMLAKGKQMKMDEEVKFAAYKQFCEGTAEEKKSNIEDAAAEIEDLQASIQKAESDAAVLAEDIAGLDEDIAGWQEDQKSATAMREKDNADYQKTLRDYEESCDALDRAIVVLKGQSKDVSQAEMLLQKVVSHKRVPLSAKRSIQSFLAVAAHTHSKAHQDPLAVSAPQAAAYEFQSGGVVDMLVGLKDKFWKEKSDLEKEEMGAKHAYDLMMLELKDSISAAESMRGQKAKLKAGKEEEAASDKGSLADTTASKAEDTTYLEDLNTQCEQKSSDYEQRQQLRAEELEAIEKAISIIASPEVSGASETHLGLAQSFSLLRAAQKGKSTGPSVVSYLQNNAERLKSKGLRMLAVQVVEAEQTMADPFKKVKKMIDDMITKLLEEANEEADHKGWCDKEMAVNGQTREDKTEEVNALSAEMDKLKADVLKLTGQIADLSDAISEIDSTVAKATEIRTAEKAKNAATIEDAKEAQTAVSQAMAVLKDFYKKASTATALVQGKQSPEDEAPETFDKPYTGLGGSSGGVIGMLEVIQSDFSKLEAETTAAESEAESTYDRLMAESSKNKAVKTADMEHKKKAKTQKESDVNDTENDLKGTEKELQSALFYYEKLKPSCVDAGVSYEDRVAKREEEIESLKTALKILSGEA
jgi:septal ring factor EnvC (AmiA/AmiB activator)